MSIGAFGEDWMQVSRYFEVRFLTSHNLFVVFFFTVVNDYYSHVVIYGIVEMVGIATMGCNTIVGSNPIPTTKRML